jgi:hypothetical protein
MDVGTIDDVANFTRLGKFTSKGGAPFQMDLLSAKDTPNFNASVSAFFTLLASRQYAARAANRYPMTFFIGPGSVSLHDIAQRKSRGESEILSRYDRIAFTSNDAIGTPVAPKIVRWVAIASLPVTSSIEGRSPIITTWANFDDHIDPDNLMESKEELETLRSTIGIEAVQRWKNVIYPKIIQSDGIFTKKSRTSTSQYVLNDELLVQGNADFVRTTGSTQMHSILWPLTQMSMTQDDAIFFDENRLHTKAIVAESSMDQGTSWYKSLKMLTANEDEDPMKTAWLRWTTAMLSTGTLPYIRHTQAPPPSDSIPYIPIRSRPHLTVVEMKALTGVIHKRLVTSNPK